MGSVSHSGKRIKGLSYFVDVDDEAVLGPVTIPTAKPPIAPAIIPINANSRVLSIKVEFPRFAISPPSRGPQYRGYFTLRA
jgi:hypothetical protein